MCRQHRPPSPPKNVKIINVSPIRPCPRLHHRCGLHGVEIAQQLGADGAVVSQQLGTFGIEIPIAQLLGSFDAKIGWRFGAFGAQIVG